MTCHCSSRDPYMYRISSSGGCQRLRALLLLLLPKIGAFRGPSAHVPPMSATNLFPTDSDGVESPVDEALASESRSLDFRDHHRFYIIRHGETDANAADVIQGSSDVSRLTEKGKEQAASLYEGLVRVANESYGGELRVDAIYCSPLTRARDTLKILRQSYSSAKEGGGEISVHLVSILFVSSFFLYIMVRIEGGANSCIYLFLCICTATK